MAHPPSLPYSFLGQFVFCNPLPERLGQIFPNSPMFFAWVERNVEEELVLDCIKLEGPTYPAFLKILEEHIRLKPDQWVGWSHRRFFSFAPGIYGNHKLTNN